MLGFRRQITSSDMANEYAARAAAATGETAYVVGWIDDEIIVLGTARGSGAIQAAEIPQGTAGDAHARASGKLLLAMASADVRSHYLKNHPLTRRTANTLTQGRKLEAELRSISQTWVSREREEYELGLSCLAVPLGNAPSMLVLGISAPVARMEANSERYIQQLRTIAANIT
jgi:DNA-binding IclR family transcriptional regulator